MPHMLSHEWCFFGETFQDLSHMPHNMQSQVNPTPKNHRVMKHADPDTLRQLNFWGPTFQSV